MYQVVSGACPDTKIAIIAHAFLVRYCLPVQKFASNTLQSFVRRNLGKAMANLVYGLG
jgi:hypothetical protein